jgi:putative integral membrane protein (TIGR02587 family)
MDRRPPLSSEAVLKKGASIHAERFHMSLAVAFGGALVFTFPLLMTMEMWWLGFFMDRGRLALFLLVLLPVLIGLSYHSGFEENLHGLDHFLDVFIAYGVGFMAAAVLLVLFGVIRLGMSADEVVGKIALQTIPGSIGAMLARSLLGLVEDHELKQRHHQSYGWNLFLRSVGALFLAFTAAPTEEMILIAYQMTDWHALGLGLLSLLVIHAFGYAVPFREQVFFPADTPLWSSFLRFTVVGYAVALLISGYILWTFGRMDGLALGEIVRATLVLGFPASLGAAAARLIL